jgi:hypothetical protein
MPLDTPHTMKRLCVILLMVGVLFGASFGLRQPLDGKGGVHKLR